MTGEVCAQSLEELEAQPVAATTTASPAHTKATRITAVNVLVDRFFKHILRKHDAAGRQAGTEFHRFLGREW